MLSQTKPQNISILLPEIHRDHGNFVTQEYDKKSQFEPLTFSKTSVMFRQYEYFQT